MTISKEISNMKETKTFIKRPSQSVNDPVSDIVNLLGCNYQKAMGYYQKYGSVEKAFLGFQTEEKTV